ncbi:MAG: ankyrin repeat domain-containing protein, partial [Deltaproteobacteria bacterium]
RTPLHYVTYLGYGDVAKFLVSKGANVNAKDSWGRTLLHWAASKGWRDIATRLIDFGADTEVPDRVGNTALHKSARHGNYDLSSLLIEHAANVNASTPDLHITPLHQAVRYGHEKIVRLLLKSGARVNAYSNLYGTPLHWAAESGHRSIAEVLLEHDASTSILDSHRLTPGDRARVEGQKDLIAFFNTVNGSRKSGMSGLMRFPGNHTMDEECVFPKRMHSTSRMVLADYLDGQTPTAEFLRLFSLSNSRYLSLGNCLVKVLEKD